MLLLASVKCRKTGSYQQPPIVRIIETTPKIRIRPSHQEIHPQQPRLRRELDVAKKYMTNDNRVSAGRVHCAYGTGHKALSIESIPEKCLVRGLNSKLEEMRGERVRWMCRVAGKLMDMGEGKWRREKDAYRTWKIPPLERMDVIKPGSANLESFLWIDLKANINSMVLPTTSRMGEWHKKHGRDNNQIICCLQPRKSTHHPEQRCHGLSSLLHLASFQRFRIPSEMSTKDTWCPTSLLNSNEWIDNFG